MDIKQKPKKMRNKLASEAIYEQVELIHSTFVFIKDQFESNDVRNPLSDEVVFIRREMFMIKPEVENLMVWAENNYLMERDALNDEERTQVSNLCKAINAKLKEIYSHYIKCAGAPDNHTFSYIRYMVADFRGVFSCLSRTVSFLSSVDSYV